MKQIYNDETRKVYETNTPGNTSSRNNETQTEGERDGNETETGN